MEDFFPESEEFGQDILFISEIPHFNISLNPSLSSWLEAIINQHDGVLRLLTYIFVDDQQLLAINQEYLQHDSFTDIITFPYSQLPFIHGDIFISVDRVKENAQKFGTELCALPTKKALLFPIFIISPTCGLLFTTQYVSQSGRFEMPSGPP